MAGPHRGARLDRLALTKRLNSYRSIPEGFCRYGHCMSTAEVLGKATRALEITVALEGRRIGLCGFDAEETERISGIFHGIGALAMHFDERLLAESARICDA